MMVTGVDVAGRMQGQHIGERNKDFLVARADTWMRQWRKRMSYSAERTLNQLAFLEMIADAL